MKQFAIFMIAMLFACFAETVSANTDGCLNVDVGVNRFVANNHQINVLQCKNCNTIANCIAFALNPTMTTMSDYCLPCRKNDNLKLQNYTNSSAPVSYRNYRLPRGALSCQEQTFC